MRPFQILAILFFLLGSFNLQAESLFSKEELDNPKKYAAKFDSVFRTVETPKFKLRIISGTVILHNTYASSEINNSNYWRPNYLPDSIHLILSKYPKEKGKWITNYYELLASRLKALYAIDPRLNNPYLSHSLFLQTDCENETEAKSLFHGFVIYAHFKDMPIFKKEINLSSQEIDIEQDTLELDSNFYPEVSLCYINGRTYAMAEFQNKVWISWEKGVVLTKDTFASLEEAGKGFTDHHFNSFAVFKKELYGMSDAGRIWKCSDSSWRIVFTPTSQDRNGTALYSNDQVLIAVYKDDDFYISSDGQNFINRFYREQVNGQWQRKNLSPLIKFSGDSILIFSGRSVYVSKDHLLNIKKIYEFRKNELEFIYSAQIDGSKWYLTGWFQDEEYEYHQSFMVSIDAGKNWQKIQIPEKGSAFCYLFQKAPGEPLWLLGSGQTDYQGSRTFIRKASKWYHINIPSPYMYLYYGGYYVGKYVGGIILLIPESEIRLN